MRLGPRVVVEDERGERRDAVVKRVQPIAPDGRLPAYRPEVEDASLLSSPPDREQAHSAWKRDPSWQRSNVSLDVVEPRGTWAVVGGAVVGLGVSAAAAYALTSCTPDPTRSCEDSGSARLGVMIFALPIGALVGGVAGGVVHQLFGDPRYRVVAAP